MKNISIASLIFSGIPLVIYPFVLLANIMSFATVLPGADLSLLAVVGFIFQLGSLFYPVVFFTCWSTYRRKLKLNELRAAFVYSVLPLVCLIILGFGLILWMKPKGIIEFLYFIRYLFWM